MSVSGPTERIIEGRTTLIVPKLSVGTRLPSKTPAFYNPKARLCRDLSVLICKAFANHAPRTITVADALAGVGARGLRIAVEVPKVSEVHLNDLNSVAIEYASKSAGLNGVSQKCRLSVLDACHFLALHSAPSTRFDVIDLDPFGSPSPFVDSALRAIRDGGLLSVTATDSAVLCGSHPRVARRRYYGYSLRTEYCHEVGVRLLTALLARIAARLNLGITPLMSHCSMHYTRVTAAVRRGARWADEAIHRLGYVDHCFRCEERRMSEKPLEKCSCGGAYRVAGPLWASDIHDAGMVRELLSLSAEDHQKEAERLLQFAAQEVGMPPTYHVVDRVASGVRTRTISPTLVVEELKRRGFRSSRTSINPKGVKTDASRSEVRAVVRELALKTAPGTPR